MIYTIFFIPVLVWKFLSMPDGWLFNLVWVIILLLISHLFLDYRKFEFWIMEKIKGIKINRYKGELFPTYFTEGKKEVDMDKGLFLLLLITIDQILHIVVLAFIALMLS